MLGYIAYEDSPTMALPSAGVQVLSALRGARRYGLRRGVAGPMYSSTAQRLTALQTRVRAIGSQVSDLPAHLQDDVNERMQTLIGISNQTAQFLAQGREAQATAAITSLETELASFEGYLASLDPAEVTVGERARLTPAQRAALPPPEGLYASSGSLPWGWIFGGVAVAGGLLLWLGSR